MGLLRQHELHGDLRVEFTNPPMRFGLGLHVLVTGRDGTVTHHAVALDPETGEPLFEAYHADTTVKPLILMSKGLESALQAATAQLPAPSTDATREHLADAREIRDRLLTMIEKQIKS